MQLAQLLSEAAAQGQLAMAEYENRLSRAYGAKTYDELQKSATTCPAP